MASSCKKCFFCSEDVENPQNGWCLKNSTYAQLCHICSFAFEQGTFCHMFHDNENGWRNCHDCGKLVHCGCVMALNTFEINDISGVTCKECIMKKTLMGSQLDASSYVPSSKDYFHPENCSNSNDILTGKELSADSRRAKPFTDDLNNLDEAIIEAIIEGSLQVSEPSKHDHLFLFEKKLSPTDCDIKANRLLLPKRCAEKFFPQVVGSQSLPLTIEDTEGRSWLFVLRSWLNKKSRKYVLDGTRKCIETMQWNVGDTLKFYRKLADGNLVIELEQIFASTSAASEVPVHRDGL